MELATFYKNTYNQEYQTQPKWKQLAITEDLRLNKSSSFVDEFICAVIQKAESEFDIYISQRKTQPDTTAKTKKPSKSKPKETFPNRIQKKS